MFSCLYLSFKKCCTTRSWGNLRLIFEYQITKTYVCIYLVFWIYSVSHEIYLVFWIYSVSHEIYRRFVLWLYCQFLWMIAVVPLRKSWRIRLNLTKTNHNKARPCAYFLGCTVGRIAICNTVFIELHPFDTVKPGQNSHYSHRARCNGCLIMTLPNNSRLRRFVL